MKIPGNKLYKILSIALVVGMICIYYGYYPHNNLHSSASNGFRFEDYSDDKEKMLAALKIAFPKGTPKSYVTQTLIDDAGADLVSTRNENYAFRKNGLLGISSHSVNFTFENDKTEHMWFGGNQVY